MYIYTDISTLLIRYYNTTIISTIGILGVVNWKSVGISQMYPIIYPMFIIVNIMISTI